MTEGKRNAQKACFAILKNLKPQLEAEGLSADVVWDYVKETHNVDSRSNLNERDYIILQARLSAASRDSHLFLILCSEIQNSFPQCRVVRVNADLSMTKVYDSILTDDIRERCRRHAEATGCTVRLHGADGKDAIEEFVPDTWRPAPDGPPIAKDNPDLPSRVFELHRQGSETHWVEVPFPDTSDLAGWGQRHADSTGHDVQITDRMGQVVLMEFSAMPACAPESVVSVGGNSDSRLQRGRDSEIAPTEDGVNDVSIDGQKWILLNQWDDKWHWVKLDQSMESHIITAVTRKDAVNSLITMITGAVSLPDGKRIDVSHILVLSTPDKHTAGDFEWYNIRMVMSGNHPKTHENARFDTREDAMRFYEYTRKAIESFQ